MLKFNNRNTRKRYCSTVTDTIIQQSLGQLFISRWHNYSTVTSTIVQQSLALLFSSHRYNCSTVTGTIVQQPLAWLFNCRWHGSSTVTGTILSFFNAGRIQQGCSTVMLVFCNAFKKTHLSDIVFSQENSPATSSLINEAFSQCRTCQ